MDAQEGVRDVQPGDVVQITPEWEVNKAFAACLVVVSEVKSWGIQGYVQALGTREEMGGQAYIRVKWEDLELVGAAYWVTQSIGEDVEDGG